MIINKMKNWNSKMKRIHSSKYLTNISADKPQSLPNSQFYNYMQQTDSQSKPILNSPRKIQVFKRTFHKSSLLCNELSANNKSSTNTSCQTFHSSQHNKLLSKASSVRNFRRRFNKQMFLSSDNKFSSFALNSPTKVLSPEKVPFTCKHNVFRKYKRLKNLNDLSIEQLTSSNLDIGFLKNNPKIQVKMMTKQRLKEQEQEALKANKAKLVNANKQTNTNASECKSEFGLEYNIKKLAQSKVFLANVSKTKEQNLMNLFGKLTHNVCYGGNAVKNKDESQQQHKHQFSQAEYNDKELKRISLKRFSLIDRLILNLVDKDGMLEDYAIGTGKPFDKYSRFRKICEKEKLRVGGLLYELHKAPSVNEEKLKAYINKLKWMKHPNSKGVSESKRNK